jgi:glutamate-1-semialdehyde 2,1-aminomutase
VVDGQTVRSRERSETLEFEAARVIPGAVNSNFRLSTAPPHRFWESAKGSRLTDVDGNEFIDYVLGMGTAVLGHSPAPLLARVAQAQQRLQCPAGQQVAEIELARRITSLVPSAELVRIGCTGSEMVQLAFRLARAATGRALVVKFEGHYHGWFDSAFSGTTELPPKGEFSAPIQSTGQSTKALADLAVLPWNDLGLLEAFVDSRGTEVAAIIMEPVLCNTSVILPKDGYLEGVRRLCDRHGIVLIFDEVITGFRLDVGGAQALLGVTPDLTVLGKALGAGFPIAGLAGKASLMQLLGNGTVMHGGTYNGNAMALAAALAAIDTLSDRAAAPHVRLRYVAGLLVEGLERLSKDTGASLSVQGVGPVFNTAFDPPGPITDFRSYQASNLAKQLAFITALDAEGIRVTGRGTWFVSLAHTEADVELTLDAADQALRRISE